MLGSLAQCEVAIDRGFMILNNILTKEALIKSSNADFICHSLGTPDALLSGLDTAYFLPEGTVEHDTSI